MSADTDLNSGRCPSGRATQASPQAPSGLGHPVSVPNADDPATKTPAQLGRWLAALTEFIATWSKVVAQAEEQARKDRELLMGAMAELTRVTHFVARSGADALEAQGMSARQGQDPQGLEGEARQPGGEAMRPDPFPMNPKPVEAVR